MDVAKTDLEKNMNKYKKDIDEINYSKLYTLFNEIINVNRFKKNKIYIIQILNPVII